MKWLEKENWVNKYGLIMQTEIKESTLHLADCAGTLAYIELIRIAANEKR
jgi:hypothetical protein